MLTKNQDCATFHIRDIRENVFTQIWCLHTSIIDVWRHHVGLLLRGTYMAAGNQQKHLSLNFPHKLKALILFGDKECLDIKILKNW